MTCSTWVTIVKTTGLYPSSSPTRMYKTSYSSSAVFFADAISSVRDFILAIYLAIVILPFLVIARGIRVFTVLALDYNA